MEKLIARASCTYQGELNESEVINMLEIEGNYRVTEANHPNYRVKNESSIEDDENGKAIVFLVKAKDIDLLSTLSNAVKENLLTGDLVATDISFAIGGSHGN